MVENQNLAVEESDAGSQITHSLPDISGALHLDSYPRPSIPDIQLPRGAAQDDGRGEFSSKSLLDLNDFPSIDDVIKSSSGARDGSRNSLQPGSTDADPFRPTDRVRTDRDKPPIFSDRELRQLRLMLGTASCDDRMAEDKDVRWDAARKAMGSRPAGNLDIWTPWDHAHQKKHEEIYGPMHFLE